jgi:hypothetical protein
MCGYVHLFVTAQIKSRDAKDNRFRYFKGNPQAGCCKQRVHVLTADPLSASNAILRQPTAAILSLVTKIVAH